MLDEASAEEVPTEAFKEYVARLYQYLLVGGVKFTG